MSTSTLKKVALYTLGAFSGVALSLSVQSFAAEKDKKDNETLPVQSIRNMAEVYGQIKANYYQDKSDADLFEGAMKGMVSDLDPHSEYMDKKGYADMKESTSGEFGGLGMEITRAIIKVKSVRHHLLEPNYGYIRVSQFQERTVAGINEAAKALIKANKGAPLKGIILDLRDDPGGLLDGAVGVSAAFLPADAKVVSTKGRDGKEGMVLKARPEDYIRTSGRDPLADLPAELKTIPMTVLINSGSASASEIVAGALQDHKRAVVVGTQSFGKGSVQTLIPLSNGSAVKLTTALYYTPNDRSIQAQGIVPDVEVKDKDRAFESREADLAGHIGNPLGGEDVNSSNEISTPDSNEAAKADENAKSKKGKDKDKDEDLSSRRIPNPAKDDQLRKALDLVKNPAEWQKSLGLAAKKPAPKKDKKDGR